MTPYAGGFVAGYVFAIVSFILLGFALAFGRGGGTGEDPERPEDSPGA